MTSFHGDTGPYLQYTHARLCSLATRADVQDETLTDADISLLKEPIAVDLVRLLVLWPSTVRTATQLHQPSNLVTYLFRLGHLVNRSYKHMWVLGQEPEVKKARMALYVAARQVLANGLKLLALTPVTR
jgi:arginyl-tRNA synthetase